MKAVTLRYFDMSCPSLTSDNSLVERLISKLKSSASSRMMPLNKQESQKSDLISDFLVTTQGKKLIAGTYLRIANSTDVPIITEEMLKQDQFKVSTINNNAGAHEKTCLDYFYFCMSDEKLVVTLDSRSTINRMETYINWLLNTNDLGYTVSFTPIVDETTVTAADLKQITILNNASIFIGSPDSSAVQQESSVINIAKGAVMKLFNDADNLGNLFEENICSAKLVIKFSKPRNMDKEEYMRKTIGASLKPIADSDGIRFQTNGKKIKGSDVLKTETIEVDDENGIVNEQEVYQKMIQKLK
ncbi:MAG: hypothetical protein PUC61_00410 [Bacteroidales bacterium]|nr:hypothetical protein [Bacteroidales bacterium]